MFATLESWHQMNQGQFWQAFAVTTAKACSKLCLVRLVPAFHLMTPLGNWLYHSSKTVSVQPCCLFDLFVCYDVMFATLESWHQMNQAQFWQAFAVTTAKACSKLCLVRWCLLSIWWLHWETGCIIVAKQFLCNLVVYLIYLVACLPGCTHQIIVIVGEYLEKHHACQSGCHGSGIRRRRQSCMSSRGCDLMPVQFDWSDGQSWMSWSVWINVSDMIHMFLSMEINGVV